MEISFGATHRQIQNGANRPITGRNMAALFFVHSNICYTQKENKMSGMTGIVEAAFT